MSRWTWILVAAALVLVMGLVVAIRACCGERDGRIDAEVRLAHAEELLERQRVALIAACDERVRVERALAEERVEQAREESAVEVQRVDVARTLAGDREELLRRLKEELR